MRIIVSKADLTEGLKSVQGIVTKGTMRELEYVKVEAYLGLELTTTDLTITITKKVNCKVIEGGAILLPCKQLSAFVAFADDSEIEISVDDKDIATIKASSAKLKLTGIPVSRFPKLPTFQGEKFKLPQKVFADMIRKTGYAASCDISRGVLQGVLVRNEDGQMTVVATDGRRLALVETTVSDCLCKSDILLPIRTLRELQKAIGRDGDIDISTDKTQTMFQIGGTTVYTKLLEGSYPNYKAVIPSVFTERIRVNRKRLVDAISRVSIVVSNGDSPVQFSIKEKMLTISAKNDDASETKDVWQIEYLDNLSPHEDISVNYNYIYMLDALKAIDDENIEIEMNTKGPTKLTGKDGFTYVIMPIALG